MSGFASPRSVATDAYGNIFVPNRNEGVGIDVFASSGLFLTEISNGLEKIGLEDVILDSKGHLYVYGYDASAIEAIILRLDPAPEYDPENGIIAYEDPVKVVGPGEAPGLLPQNNSIAVDSGDHLYLDLPTHINMYSSAEEGNILLDSSIGAGTLKTSQMLTVDSRNGDIYASDYVGSSSVVRVFSNEVGHPLRRTISGFSAGLVAPAVNESTGLVFVSDIRVRRKIYVFEESSSDQVVSESESVIEHSFNVTFPVKIAMDNWALSPNKGYLFVPSMSKNEAPPDHVYAFEPAPLSEPPEVTAVGASEITETEARLEATIDPGNPATDFRLEYVTEAAFAESGFAEATVADEGVIPGGNQSGTVSASVEGLAPGTAYRVRAFAENECESGGCSDESEATFSTYPHPVVDEFCPNDSLHVGPSAHLPDCRAYELVSPRDTGGRPPQSVGVSDGDLFGSATASAAGGSVSFIVGSGGIPGMGGSGAFFGDGYLSKRSSAGWQTHLAGPSGDQMSNPEAGGLSPDHGFAAWAMNGLGSGSLFIEGGAHYIRYPDGSFHLVGRGSEGDDPKASIKKITEAGGHMIFRGRVQLEPNAPPTGTAAIYDRTIDPLTGEEEAHVVSLLPEEETPAESEDATYEGASADGAAIAFKVGDTATSPLYVRVENVETLVAALPPGAQFAGFSDDHRYVFYFLAGDLYRFAARTSEIEQMTASGDALFVNVSPDGSHAYFVSPSILTGEEENSQGDKAIEGEENLYVWDEEGTRFIGTVAERDVEGEFRDKNVWLDGLRLWAFNPNGGPKPVTTGETAKNPSRTTADGSVYLFESRANLTGYNSGGKAEIYRFDASGGELSCLSCSPTSSAATGDATLQTVGYTFVDPGSTKTFAQVPNLRDDGKRAFFESPDPLVLKDTNGVLDVYEWEEEGIGSCLTPGGCIYLISSGHSSRPSYLYGVSATGDDVFFTTSDLLTRDDHDETPSIYDARVGGGFSSEGEGDPCVRVGTCIQGPTPPPALSTPAQPVPGASDNVKTCPKGKHKVKRNGKTRCVKMHHKRRHKHKRHRSGGRR